METGSCEPILSVSAEGKGGLLSSGRAAAGRQEYSIASHSGLQESRALVPLTTHSSPQTPLRLEPVPLTRVRDGCGWEAARWSRKGMGLGFQVVTYQLCKLGAKSSLSHSPFSNEVTNTHFLGL